MDDLCCSYLRGKVYVAKRKAGATAGDIKAEAMAELGNVTAFNISHNINELSIPDYTKAAGNACSLKLIEDGTLTLTLACFKAKNLAIGMGGEGSFENALAGTITDEAHIVKSTSDRIAFDFIPSGSIVVTDETGTTTYVEGTDYEVTDFGIQIIATGSIDADDSILVDYAYLSQSVIEALLNAGQDYVLLLEATNFADNKRKVKLEVYNVNFGASDSIDMFGDDLSTFDISGTIQSDPTKTDASKSAFYKYIVGQPAS